MGAAVASSALTRVKGRGWGAKGPSAVGSTAMSTAVWFYRGVVAEREWRVPLCGWCMKLGIGWKTMFGKILSFGREGWGFIARGAAPIFASAEAVSTASVSSALTRAEVSGWGATGRVVALSNSWAWGPGVVGLTAMSTAVGCFRRGVAGRG